MAAVVGATKRHRGERRRQAGFWSDALWRVRRDTPTMIAFSVLLTIVLLAAGADVLAEHLFKVDYARTDLERTYAAPTLDEPALWLGADHLGRSEVVRMLYGGRVSMLVGVLGATVALTIGMLLGLTAGYFRGRWDDIVVWLVTTIETIPLIFLLILVGALFRMDPLTLALFIGSLAWVGACNISRGQTFAVRERDYVLAARTIGAPAWWIILRHIFPNVLPLMIVVAMLSVGGTILGESALSYLGFGIQPPVPSWGNMLSGATQFYFRGPHLIVLPGLAITVTVLCVYLVGDGLRDALDPRLRGSERVGRAGR